MKQYEILLSHQGGGKSNLVRVIVEAKNQKDAFAIAVQSMFDELKIHKISVKELVEPFQYPQPKPTQP